jgi:hypothetical protein
VQSDFPAAWCRAMIRSPSREGNCNSLGCRGDRINDTISPELVDSRSFSKGCSWTR